MVLAPRGVRCMPDGSRAASAAAGATRHRESPVLPDGFNGQELMERVGWVRWPPSQRALVRIATVGMSRAGRAFFL